MSKTQFCNIFRMLKESSIVWTGVLTIYIVIGAVIFDTIEERQYRYVEGQNPEEIHGKTSLPDPAFVKEINEKYQFNLSAKQVDSLRLDLGAFVGSGNQEKHEPLKSDISTTSGIVRWGYFSFITLTTVGYGDLCPQTNLGKAILFPYCLVGIPLMIVTLSMIGDYIIQLQLRLIRTGHVLRETPTPKIAYICTLISNALLAVVYCLCGAVVTSGQQHWSFFDSCYYWLVFFTTIGYGDLIAYNWQLGLANVIIWNLYRFLGLILVSGVVLSAFKYFSFRNQCCGCKCGIRGERLYSG